MCFHCFGEHLLGIQEIQAWNVLLVEKISVVWILKARLKSVCLDSIYSSSKSNASFRLRRNKNMF